ncbi:hypothetical protein [Pelagicoccus albus]|uniref:Transglutaminase-like superfamily protein n=1 Tax=Pelagicoccus albus TaxID=415222 RepID=A0A7X1B3R8_9BACT|nr:hypothetical protein [Pelagicoccus albus]MBC2605099.1 hypothetical protein [Pelagicoccus albus]
MKRLLLPLCTAVVGLALILFGFLGSDDSGNLDLEIEKIAYVMPAAHKVYANPEALDGRFYLFKAILRNDSPKVYKDVSIKYRIPGYISEWTELSLTGELHPGQTTVATCYPKFADSITDKMTESQEKAEIEITWEDVAEKDVIESEFGFRIAGRNNFVYTNITPDEISGWADIRSNAVLFPCFVTPNDPLIRYYTQVVQQKVMKGDDAGVVDRPKEAVRFLKKLYEATLMTSMVYGGSGGIPKEYDDVSSNSQEFRLPREVITGNTGQCAELSMLYASVCSAAGLDPVLYIVPGHMYPGVKINDQYFAIEATGIGGEGIGGSATADEAYETGMKSLDKFITAAQQGDPRYTIIDVHQLNGEGAIPMSLKDDSYLRGKIDELAKNFDNKPLTPAPQPGPSETWPVVNGPNPPQPNFTPAVTGPPLSIAIPNGWITAQHPEANLPILTAQISSPDMTIAASVFDVPTNDPAMAMGQIQQQLAYQGMNIVYQFEQGNQIMGQTHGYGMTLNWIGKALPYNNGIRIVSIGSPIQYYQANSQTILQLFNTIQ